MLASGSPQFLVEEEKEPSLPMVRVDEQIIHMPDQMWGHSMRVAPHGTVQSAHRNQPVAGVHEGHRRFADVRILFILPREVPLVDTGVAWHETSVHCHNVGATTR